MTVLEGCHIASLTSDTIKRTLAVNQALNQGARGDHEEVLDYLDHVENHDIDVEPQAEPLQIVGLKIGCQVCQGCTRISLGEITEITVPAGCRINAIAPGDMVASTNLLSDTGQQG